eukprot:9857817-Karenia_brevis.AAC.1
MGALTAILTIGKTNLGSPSGATQRLVLQIPCPCTQKSNYSSGQHSPTCYLNVQNGQLPRQNRNAWTKCNEKC